MTLAFRIATRDDVRDVAALRWLLKAEDEPLDPAEEMRFIEAFAKADSERDDLVHFIATDDDNAIAVMSVVIVGKVLSPSASEAGAWGYLTNCFTRAGWRNKGVGAQLLATVRVWANEQRLEMLVVWPSDRSYAFYERAGFERPRDPLVLDAP